MAEECMNYIESTQFSALVNLSSGRRTFEKICGRDLVVKSLLEKLLDSESVFGWQVLSRVATLSQQKNDCQYENPNDVALAVYIWALSLVKLELAETAAQFALSAPNCWWARIFALHILKNIHPQDNASYSRKIVNFGGKLGNERPLRQSPTRIMAYSSAGFQNVNPYSKFMSFPSVRKTHTHPHKNKPLQMAWNIEGRKHV
ncbi:hypothetical protein VB780_26000 [Leptolyngbya sp. CCNP1308]|uniref:hypothetical protein n=1 Tax=Leptolyngbya sp. CCNP1308 TaxID=3110255 RepID=UPI002B22141C|nr:hypothetical protein [Leptolyngbya sp. CCNP1308]MEA5452054.1 hypothetical protein [Leptolyngbya sp. CCNP1308]